MTDDAIHNGDQVFEDFVEQELLALAGRAQQKGICIDCLTDRILVEMVASLMRSGISTPEILNMVADGMALAEEEEPEEGGGNGHGRRVH
jgi:hypothetical protein